MTREIPSFLRDMLAEPPRTGEGVHGFLFRAARQLHALLAPLGGSAWSGADGVNIWVHLPSGLDALQVIEQAASLGVLVAPGEPFFIRPGRGDVLRINAGAVSADRAADIGGIVAKAALTQAETTVHAIPV